MTAFVSYQNNDCITLRATSAILFYSGKSAGNELCVLHDIQADDTGQLILGAGRAPTLAFAQALAEKLSGIQPVEFLDEQIVAAGHHTVAWWTPAAKRTLLFKTESAEVNSLSGQSFACPPLLFVVKDKTLYVRALLKNKRPVPDSQTAAAPFPNVDGASGYVCLGSAVPPRSSGPSSIRDWEACFFGSYFTHSHGGITTSHPKQITGLIVEWPAMKAFPNKYLVRLKETAGNFVTNRKRV